MSGEASIRSGGLKIGPLVLRLHLVLVLLFRPQGILGRKA